MSKITLTDVASGYNLNAINNNFQAIENTLNNSVLFRDSSISNEMSIDLDMNGYSIYNVNEIDSDAVTVGGVPLADHIASLAVNVDPSEVTIARYVKTITISSFAVTLPEPYNGSASSLIVSRNGVQQPSDHYVFDGNNITFSTILSIGEVVDVIYFKSIVSVMSSIAISDVAGLQAALDAKQATLVSGVSLKTVGGVSLLGSGNIPIAGGAGGTVTTVSVVSANGFNGSIANPTTTPAVTLSTTVTGIVKGNGTALSAAIAGTDYQLPIGTISGVVKGNGTNALIAAVAGTDFIAPSGALGNPSSGTLTNCTADGTNSVGFRNIPQVSQSAAYTAVLTDAGKHILHPSADTTARTFTIPANSSVAYPIGTALTFVNQNAAGVVTIAITSDTMRLAGAGTTGSRTLAANGIATAIKLTSTEWIISGTGLT